MDVTEAHSALVVGGGVGFVDMADFAGFGVEDFAVDLELFGNFLKLGFLIDWHKNESWQDCNKKDRTVPAETFRDKKSRNFRFGLIERSGGNLLSRKLYNHYHRQGCV